MSRTIVVLSGKAGVGKDTVADYLVREKGFRRMAFADSLKRACSEIFQYPDKWNHDREMKEKELAKWPGWSPRKLLQFVGTDLFRNRFDPAVWVKSACLAIERYPGEKLWVITDARFQNEIDLVKAFFPDDRVVSCRIQRDVPAAAGIPQHASETQEISTDGVISNIGSLEELPAAIEQAWKELVGEWPEAEKVCGEACCL